MGKGKIESGKKPVKELFKNFWFEIPEYQRQYVWGDDNINQLLEDIKEHCERNISRKKEDKEEYFLGSLVLQKKYSDNKYQVLDGQQRLTTLLLIISVMRDIAKDSKTANNRDTYVKEPANPDEGIEEETHRITFSAIRSSPEFKKFCEEYIFNHKDEKGIKDKYDEIKKNNKKESDNISIGNMYNALKIIKNFFESLDELKFTEEYIYTLLNNVIMIYISTEEFDDAYRLFTIINTSGIPLSHSDILKAMNLGVIEDKGEREKWAKYWEEIEQNINSSHVGYYFDSFLYCIRDILIQKKAQQALLNEFENIIYVSSVNGKKSPEQEKNRLLEKGVKTFEFIKTYYDIYEKIILFEGIEENNFKNNEVNEYKNLIHILKKEFTSKDWITPLLMYFKKFGYERLLEFLKKLELNVLSGLICLTPSPRKDMFFKIIGLINDKDSPAEIINSDILAKPVHNNRDIIDEARRIIKEEEIYNKNYKKYILLKYEYLSQDNSTTISNYSNLQIEHVLPQKPSEDSDWLKIFNEDEREKWRHNIANLILVNSKINKALSNYEFKAKKDILNGRIQDIFNGSREILAEDEWKPDTLEKRNKKMCEKLFGY